VVINGVANFQAYSSASGPNIWTLFYSTSSSFTTSTQIAQVTGTYNTTQTQNMTSAVNSFFATNPISVKSGSTAYFRLVGHQSFSTSGSGRIPVSTVSILGTVAVAPTANMVWNGGSSGLWNYDTANMVWLDGSTSTSFIPGSIANVNSAASLAVDSAGVNAGAFTNNISFGTTTITGGNLTSGSIINVGAGNLALQATNSAGTLENYGTGTLSLSAPGAYTTVNARNGTIQALTDAALSGLVNVSGGGTLNVGTSSNTIGILTVSNGAITGTGILTASGSSFALDLKDEAVAASIRGTGGLTKLGSRTLTLSGSNAFSGDVNLNVGTLATSGDDRLPDTAVINLSTNTVFRLGGNEVVKAIAASAASAAMVDLQNYTLTLNVTASNSYTSVIMGNGGSLIKNGSSILTINETNTFTGGTTLNNGSLRIQASGNRTTNSDGTVTLASSPYGVGTLTLAGGAIYSSSTGNRNIYNNADIKGSFAFGDGTNASGAITVSTNVTGAYTRLLVDSAFTANTDTDWEQPILGSGFNLSKAGVSKLTLRSTNALSSLSVLAGTLDVRGSNSIGLMNVAGGAALAYAVSSTPFGAATINLSNGAIFGQSAAIGSTLSERTISNQINILGDVLFGIGAVTGSGGYASYLSGNVDLGNNNRTLTVANSAYFFGAVTNGGMVLNRLNTELTSTKTLGLYGANSYSDGTTVSGSVDYVNNPILQLGNNSALGSGDLALAGGGSLIVKAMSHPNDISNTDRIITNDISISTGVSGVFDTGTNSVTTLDGSLTSIVTNNMTLTGAMSGGGSLVKTNSGNLTLTGALSYLGGTTVADGNLVVVKTNLTATVSSSTVGINFSNNVLPGTYAVLPGALNGAYPPATYGNLSPGQSATFDPSTGQVVVTGIAKATPTISVTPAVAGYSYTGSYQGPGVAEVNKGGSTGDVALSYVGTGSTTYGPSAIPPTNPGSYTVTATVAADSNYQSGISSAAAFTIAKAVITVTADAKSKAYGAADPALTYQVTTGALVGSDVLSGSLSRAAGEDVGTYAISSTLANANYDVTFVPASLTVGKAAITVTADGGKSKKAGEQDPAFTYTITSGALVGSDQLTGSLNRVAGEAVGTYDITQGTLAASSNYNLTFTKASFEIQPNGPTFASAFGGASATAVGADGMANLLRYAMGANSASASVVKPVSSLDTSNLSITAIVRINDPKVTMVGQSATDLAAWSTTPIVGVRTTDQTGAIPGETERQVFSITRGGSKTFLRLVAKQTN
jgi:autotransporter-associated beta strand protein